MIEFIRKSDTPTKFLFVAFISSFITALCSLITPKIGEAIRIISIYDVFATPASIDWTIPTATGVFYGQILDIVIFVLIFIILWVYFGTTIIEKLKEI
jgi:hypothetical protein